MLSPRRAARAQAAAPPPVRVVLPEDLQTFDLRQWLEPDDRVPAEWSSTDWDQHVWRLAAAWRRWRAARAELNALEPRPR